MKALALILFAFPAFAGEPAQLITAARTQVGVTVIYDPAYVSLAFPGGAVDQSRGVCTDVVIRAMRTSWGIDLQAAVNRDMKRAFSAYPKIWGMKTADRNIDHRRVANLQTLFAENLQVSHNPMGSLTTPSAAILPGPQVLTWDEWVYQKSAIVRNTRRKEVVPESQMGLGI